MTIKKKERESNYSLLRRFNRDLIMDGKLLRVKEKKVLNKKLTRRQVRESAIRRETIRKTLQSY